MKFSIVIEGDTLEPEAQELFNLLDKTKPTAASEDRRIVEKLANVLSVPEKPVEQEPNPEPPTCGEDCNCPPEKPKPRTFADFKPKPTVMEDAEAKLNEIHGEFISTYHLKRELGSILNVLPSNFIYKWTSGHYGIDNMPAFDVPAGKKNKVWKITNLLAKFTNAKKYYYENQGSRKHS